MDAKELKQTLKNAREAIRNKDYKEALKHCKAILKVDKTNYNALVFVGVAAEGLEQPEQALSAYKKATDSAPDQLLAWQGLCNFYEKNDKAEYKDDMLQVYEKLMALYESDFEKKFETGYKLCDVYDGRGDFLKAVEIGQSLLKCCQEDGRKTLNVYKKLVKILESKKNLPDDLFELLHVACEKIVHSPPDGSEKDLESIWKIYINGLIQKTSESAIVIEKCKAMAKLFPKSAFPLEVQCQIMMNSFSAEFDVKDICDISMKLEELSGSTPMAILARGWTSYYSSDFKEARALLLEGVGMGSQSIPAGAWLLLARSQLKLHDNMGVVETSERAKKILKKEATNKHAALIREILLCQAAALLELGKDTHLVQAKELVQEVISKDSTCTTAKELLCYIVLAEGDLDQAQKLCMGFSDSSSASMLALEGWCLFVAGQLEEANTKLTKAVELSAGEDGKILYQLARVQWKQGTCHKEALTNFLKAAKVDPYYSQPFLYLGHHYAQAGDQVKARRCYQKSFDLDSNNDEAGAAFVDILNSLGEEDGALAVLSRVTAAASAGSVKWAWMRLGLHQLKHMEPTAAIASFQCALRADSNDRHCWECLAEAYATRGSYTAALKAFTKVAEMSEDNMYGLYQIASIKQTLGLYAEAVLEYRAILTKSPDYVPALKGLGEAYVHLARDSLKQVFSGRAVDQCQEAIHHLTRAASFRPDLSCVWKLMGDACTLIHVVAAERVSMRVPGMLLEKGKSAESEHLSKAQVLTLGARCYGRALKLLPECSTLWQDLGLNYYRQNQATVDLQVKKATMDKAVQALKRAVSLDPRNHKHWTSLGVVAADMVVGDSALAQHCFIQSLKAEQNNVVAWTNLGTLYFNNGQVELAHEAFKSAQSLDPGYVACWIGQAMIAETVGHEDAMDLYRHTTELGHHLEGSIGYANWVCRTLEDKSNRDSEVFKFSIVQMDAIPAACDALAKYTDLVCTNPAAYMMYGLLLERQGLYKLAAQAMGNAVKLIDFVQDQDKRNVIHSNYARVLCHVDQATEAVAQYQLIQPLNRYEDVCGLALALYRSGQLTESYQAYDQALHLAPNAEEKSHVFAAMGMVAYKVKDLDTAKTVLFQGSQCSPPSKLGLKALCSLGLIEGDVTLSAAVLQEIPQLEEDADMLTDITWLTAALALLQGKAKAGRNLILKAVHKNPTSKELWKLASKYLLQFLPSACGGATACASEVHDELTGKNKLPMYRALGCLAKGLHSRVDCHKNALKVAQKALHLQPDKLEHHIVLLSAMYAEKMIRQDPESLSFHSAYWEFVLCWVEKALEEDNTSEEMEMSVLHRWCLKQNVLNLLLFGRKEDTIDILKKALEMYGTDDLLGSLALYADNNMAALQQSLLQAPNNWLGWQLLTTSYLTQGLIENVEVIYKQFLEVSDSSHKLHCAIQLAHLSFTQLLKEGASDKWGSLCQDALGEAFKLDPQCIPANLMQGILLMKGKNPRQAKRYFHSVLQASSVTNLASRIARRLLLPIYKAKNDTEHLEELKVQANLEKDMEFLKICNK
ncbi:tetratricopeptide repeat protein 37 isoform X1 [Lingula anatina]|uniref:Tetratricopeptide repeat protein 37 isoform X1 n=1 Tax=Lingula anatina TaxID=7574 RepID=A0A1S3JAF0_LINAN|nr:tetratricopeptide repeat protein 37 isoform X1 [Lingula anatina]XP_013407176.1 tetratricopeptide repeat protein 37 isoform X1 [Lingula anatina]|eukprot:XP_013407175.1 tetratricopeptide repeat protein 37 isoform X1 [Lingula anatina]